jgi:hypothetical protein
MPFNTIEGGRWDNLIRRLFSMKQDSVAPSIGTDIVPIALVQPWRPEMAFLKGEQLAFGRAAQAAVAAQQSMVAIINPVDSGNLGMIESVLFRSTAASNIQFRWTNTVAGMGVATDQAPRDTRWARGGGAGTQQALSVRVQAVAVVPGAGVFASASILANETFALPLEFVLGPGNAFITFQQAVNTQLEVTYIWREKEANPAELLV